MGVFNNLDISLKEYCEHLERDHDKQFSNPIVFGYELGRKYAHIIMDNGTQRISHSFVVIGGGTKFSIGDILKSAGWTKPATNFIRGNVLNDDYTHISWAGV